MKAFVKLNNLKDLESRIRIIRKMKSMVLDHAGDNSQFDEEIDVMVQYCDYLVELLEEKRFAEVGKNEIG
jgi:hypothetical protein